MVLLTILGVVTELTQPKPEIDIVQVLDKVLADTKKLKDSVQKLETDWKRVNLKRKR